MVLFFILNINNIFLGKLNFAHLHLVIIFANISLFIKIRTLFYIFWDKAKSFRLNLSYPSLR